MIALFSLLRRIFCFFFALNSYFIKRFQQLVEHFILSLKLRKTWLCVKLLFLVLPLIKGVLMKLINDFVVQGRVVRRPVNGNPLEVKLGQVFLGYC